MNRGHSWLPSVSFLHLTPPLLPLLLLPVSCRLVRQLCEARTATGEQRKVKSVRHFRCSGREKVGCRPWHRGGCGVSAGHPAAAAAAKHGAPSQHVNPPEESAIRSCRILPVKEQAPQAPSERQRLKLILPKPLPLSRSR